MLNPGDPLTLVPAETPFVRAIAEAPDDDLIRLVYADWLDDQGNPYGEFIRVQVELEKLGETDPKRPALEERQRELEHAVSFDQWKKSLFSYGFEARCRRGFVDELNLNVARWWREGATTTITNILITNALASLLSTSCRFLALLSTLAIEADDNFRNYG